jgi:hypothetical protein
VANENVSGGQILTHHQVIHLEKGGHGMGWRIFIQHPIWPESVEVRVPDRNFARVVHDLAELLGIRGNCGWSFPV